MYLRRVLAALAPLLFVLAAFPAAAQETVLTNEPDPSTTTAPDAPQATWGSRCLSDSRADALVCTVTERIRSKDSNQVFGSLTVQLGGDGKPLLIASLPLGLSIPGGVSFDVDGASKDNLPLQTCDRSGCFASAPVSPALLTAMQKGTTFAVTFQSLSKQPVTLQFTLAGFAAAYKKIA
jgi:invasion protein IalB